MHSVLQLTGRTEEFNRQLREQPSDTELWLQYIKYQVGKSDFFFFNFILYSNSCISSVNQ